VEVARNSGAGVQALIVAAAAAPLLSLLLSGCGAEERGPGRKNVIIVVFDTTRADDWSVFAPERGVTPVLDALAAGGQRFSDAWSLYSVTVPSHISLFTGRSAHSDRAPDLLPEAAAGERPVGDRRSSIFTILSGQGYRTYAFSGNDNLHPENVEALGAVDVSQAPRSWEDAQEQYARVLDQYGERVVDSQRGGAAAYAERTRNRPLIVHDADYVNREALASMRQHAREYPDRPFLLFLNYNDAHDPYFPEPEWAERFASASHSEFNGNLWNRSLRQPRTKLWGLRLSMTAAGLSEADIERARSLHLAELAYADHRFGLLLAELDELGLLDGTVIVATADHGEAFGEEGRMAHGGMGGDALVRALLRVPLVMRFPDPDIAPAVIGQRVDLRDIKPTLLDYLGIEDDTSRGRTLLALIRAESDVLPPAELRPQDIDPAAVGENLIGGQGEETSQRLEKELRKLGYIE
jgi:arylsulfatase A-like enzyme